MKPVASIVLAVGLILSCGASAFSLDAVADGKTVYEQKKCQLCHSIAGVGNKKSPLDGVGSKLKPEEIRKWIIAPKEMKADTRMKAYPEITGKALDDLMEYMLSLTK